MWHSVKFEPSLIGFETIEQAIGQFQQRHELAVNEIRCALADYAFVRAACMQLGYDVNVKTMPVVQEYSVAWVGNNA